jgi:hypothetical protein
LDRRWKIPALLILLSGIAATGQGDAALPEAKWIAPEARFEELSSEPPTCERPVAAEDRLSYRVGSIAFRTPLLLGGQAARAGLSCASCHANGRVTKGFRFPGLSGAPGTADVTSSIMSKMRGDGASNPKPIPDLAADTPKVSRDPASPALGAFLTGLIVEEFDGPKPAPAVFAGLVTYVRAQSAEGCDKAGRKPITLDDQLDDLYNAMDSANMLAAQGETEGAWMMIAGGRAILGDVHSRYAGASLAEDRADILAADRLLQQLQADMRQGLVVNFTGASGRMIKLSARLRKTAERSLYNPKHLASALKRPR